MFRELNEKVYRVGGSVRDEFLNKPSSDNDFTIEATEEEFLKVFPDAQKVGNSFPVFLHPETNDEIALTRTESSSGNTYTDFIVTGTGVSIETDLSRRDFSMNSVAIKVSSGEIIDPFNGVQDIKNKIIKTINENFVKEDPLRIYRAARFAAIFDFTFDKKTFDIIKKQGHHLIHVNPERIYEELKKVYERSNQPSIFFRVLYHADVLKYHFKFLQVGFSIPAGPSKYHGNKSVSDHLLDSFDNAKINGHDFSIAIASLLHDAGKIITNRKELPHHYGHENRGIKLIEAFFKQHRFDAKTMKLAKLASKHHMYFHKLTEVKKPIKLIRFFRAIKDNFEDVTKVAINDHGVSEKEFEILKKLEKTFKETVINIPKEVQQKGKDAIINFVEQKYVEFYRAL